MEKISIDMIPRGINPVVNLSQYDEGREICLALFENGNSFELDGSEVLELNILKPDGTVIAETLPSVSGDLVLFDITILNREEVTHGNYKSGYGPGQEVACLPRFSVRRGQSYPL